MGTILSFFTGKAWQVGCIALGALLLASGVYIMSLHVKLSIQGDELTKKEVTIKEQMRTIAIKRTEIELQNSFIQSQKVDYEARLKEAQSAKVEIKEKYKLIYKWVDAQKGDTNATSCDNARSFFNSVTW